MSEKASFLLKDHLFNKEKLEYLTNGIEKVYPQFKKREFENKVLSQFPKLELKERISHLSQALKEFLPKDYLTALKIIIASLPEELNPSKKDNDYGEFILAPLSDYVAINGCNAIYLQESLSALREITKRFSVEYAIRSFINEFPKESLEFLHICAEDENYHVRRLASEGLRPKLPWAQNINIDYHEPIRVLDKLFYDDSRFVTRSVANHLNDLSKLEPSLAINTIKRWQESEKQSKKEMDYISKHALRTLVKQGNKNALSLLGYGVPEIVVNDLRTHKERVKIGENLEFSFELKSLVDQNLLIDYVIQYAPNNVAKNKKVFKIKQISVSENEIIKITKKHGIRLLKTRRVYVGKHQMLLQINGSYFGKIDFEVYR